MQSIAERLRQLLGISRDDVRRAACKRSREPSCSDDDDDDPEPIGLKRYRTVRSHFPKIMPREEESEWTVPRAAAAALTPKVRHVPIVREDSYFLTSARPSGHSSPLPGMAYARPSRSSLGEASTSSFVDGNASSASSYGRAGGYIRPNRYVLQARAPLQSRVISLDDDDDDDEDENCKFVEVAEPPRSNYPRSKFVLDDGDDDEDLVYVQRIQPKKPQEYSLRRVKDSLAGKKNRLIDAHFSSLPSAIQAKSKFSYPKVAKTAFFKPKSVVMPRKRRSVTSECFKLDEKKDFQELIARTRLNLTPKSSYGKLIRHNALSESLFKSPSLERPTSGFVDLTRDYSKKGEILTNGSLSSIINIDSLASDRTNNIKRLDEIEKDLAKCELKKKENPIKAPPEKLENTLEVSLRHNPMCKDEWLADLNKRYQQISLHKESEVEKIEEEAEVEEVEELPELTDEQEAKVDAALRPHPPDEVLIEKFNLSIHRRDIATLSGLNWLNDEVINFYMNLLMERSNNNEKLPKVYCMNTFFLPRLMQAGHVGIKRWTRKVDIFSFDLIMVPVHLGVHWCMSAIDLKKHTIKYYDSMGGKNMKCCNALLKYLEEEKMDKKRETFDSSPWSLECVQDIPQQMNGSDCGMFSCMFAEYISRNTPITFTQNDMPYFRRKMILEIIEGCLLL